METEEDVDAVVTVVDADLREALQDRTALALLKQHQTLLTPQPSLASHRVGYIFAKQSKRRSNGLQIVLGREFRSKADTLNLSFLG